MKSAKAWLALIGFVFCAFLAGVSHAGLVNDIGNAVSGAGNASPPCGAVDQSPCQPGNACAPALQLRDGKCRTPCGGLNQGCCPGNLCGRADAVCRNNQCVQECGGSNQACCLSGNACNTGNACLAGRCAACGSSGLPCCPSGTACQQGFVCEAGMCGQCGRVGQRCCENNICTGPGGALASPDPSLVCKVGLCAPRPVLVALKPDLYFTNDSVQLSLWAEKLRFTVANRGRALNLPATVYLYLYKVEGGRRQLLSSSETRTVPPLCPLPANPSSAPCIGWFEGDFHVPITSFAKEVELVISPAQGDQELDSNNNTYKLSIPGTLR